MSNDQANGDAGRDAGIHCDITADPETVRVNFWWVPLVGAENGMVISSSISGGRSRDPGTPPGKALPDGYIIPVTDVVEREFDRERYTDFTMRIDVSGSRSEVIVPAQPRPPLEQSQAQRTLTGMIEVNQDHLQTGSASINLDDLVTSGDGVFKDVHKAGPGEFNANPGFHVSPMTFVVGKIRATFTVDGAIDGRLLTVKWDCSRGVDQSEIRRIRFLVVG